MGLTGVMEISAGGGSFKLEGKPGDMKELAEVFERREGRRGRLARAAARSAGATFIAS